MQESGISSLWANVGKEPMGENEELWSRLAAALIPKTHATDADKADLPPLEHTFANLDGNTVALVSRSQTRVIVPLLAFVGASNYLGFAIFQVSMFFEKLVAVIYKHHVWRQSRLHIHVARRFSVLSM